MTRLGTRLNALFRSREAIYNVWLSAQNFFFKVVYSENDIKCGASSHEAKLHVIDAHLMLQEALHPLAQHLHDLAVNPLRLWQM